MTTHDTLHLTDIDNVLPPEFELLQPTDPRHDNRAALRAVRDEASAHTYYFSSAQEYLKFATSIMPRRCLLAEEAGTRYVQLSAHYDADPYFHASLTHTVAAFTRSSITLHRMKSDETAVRFVLSQEEMAALVESYQTYLADCEEGRLTRQRDFDPFVDLSDEDA